MTYTLHAWARQAFELNPTLRVGVGRTCIAVRALQGQGLASTAVQSDSLKSSFAAQTCTLDNGRVAATAITRMKTAMEYGRVPPAQVGPLVRSLLGALYVR